MSHYECNKKGCDSYYVGECAACQEESKALDAKFAVAKERDRLWLQQREVFEARLEAAEAILHDPMGGDEIQWTAWRRAAGKEG